MPNAVNPFVRLGDNVEFQYETNEPVWESGVLTDVASRYYAEKILTGCESLKSYELQYEMGTVACNDAWRASKLQKVNYIVKNINKSTLIAEEGVQSPVITVTDYAGNTANIYSQAPAVNYPAITAGQVPTSRGWSLDWRLLIDSTIPDKQNIDTSIWKDLKDGVNADGVTPEVDRLPVTPISPTGEVNKWVIRGSTISMKLRGEKYTRAMIPSDSRTGDGTIVNPSNTNCTVVGSSITRNGLVVKSNEICDLVYSYTWTGTGAQNELGEAYDKKEFRYYLIDLAGNVSATSDGVTVYNDRTAPKLATGNLTSNDVNSPVTEGFTKSLNIKSTDNGEMKSDVSYSLSKPNGSVYNFSTIRADNLGNSSINIELGTQSDERAGCTNLVNNRRIGICEDGVYKVTTKHTDTSGNMNAGFVKSVERDTVAPAAPIADVVADEGNYNINLKVSGEAGTLVIVNGKEMPYWQIEKSINVVWKETYLYDYTYNFQIQLKDKAGNLSAITNKSYKTKASPILVSQCPANAVQILGIPFVGEYEFTSGFSTTRESINGSPTGHDALDFALPYGTQVIAPADGVVENIYTEEAGGLVMLVNHPQLGLKTLYAHLSGFMMAKGSTVKTGQVIALSGNSGKWTTGAHLHFGVQVNGVMVDPISKMANCQTTQLTPSYYIVKLPSDFTGTEANYFADKTYRDLLNSTTQGVPTISIKLNADGSVASIGDLQPNGWVTYTKKVGSNYYASGISLPKGIQVKATIERVVSGQWWCGAICQTKRIETKMITILDSKVVVYKNPKSWLAETVERNTGFFTGPMDKKLVNEVYPDASGKWTANLGNTVQDGDKIGMSTYASVDFMYTIPETNKTVKISSDKIFSYNTNEYTVGGDVFYKNVILQPNAASFPPTVKTGIENALKLLPSAFYQAKDKFKIRYAINGEGLLDECKINKEKNEATAAFVSNWEEDTFVWCSKSDAGSVDEVTHTVIHELTHHFTKKITNSSDIKYGGSWDKNKDLENYYELLFNKQDWNVWRKKWEPDTNLMSRISEIKISQQCKDTYGGMSDSRIVESQAEYEIRINGTEYQNISVAPWRNPENTPYFTSWYQCKNTVFGEEEGFLTINNGIKMPEEEMAESIATFYNGSQDKNSEGISKNLLAQQDIYNFNNKNAGRWDFINSHWTSKQLGE
jgi:murein DD-endopeptidase MepM/ murein hydrolase activator NlpD